MIRTNSGEGHLYELAYPRFSLLNSRISFVSAVSKCAPEVFERLHDKPLKAYQASWLLKLKRKRRVDFWRHCCGVEDDLYVLDPDYKREFSLSSGYQDRYARIIHQFFGDWGLNITKDDHIAYFNTDIQPRLKEWLKTLEEWGRDHHLKAGWMFQWAFLKLDSYADRERPYESPIFQEFNPTLPDMFGRDIQPPVWEKPYINQSLLFDFWIEEFQFVSDPWRPLIHTQSCPTCISLMGRGLADRHH